MKKLNIIFIIENSLGVLVKKSLEQLINQLPTKEFVINYALISVRNKSCKKHKFLYKDFTNSIIGFSKKVKSIKYEASNSCISLIDAISLVTEMKLNKLENNIIITFSSNSICLPDKSIKSLPQLFTKLSTSHISQIYLVSDLSKKENKLTIELSKHFSKHEIHSLVFDYSQVENLDKVFKGISAAIKKNSTETKEEKTFAEKLEFSKIFQEQIRGKDLNTPYTIHAGQNVIPDALKDIYGNAQGNQYDLAKDGAFKGVQIAVLQLYDGTRYGDDFQDFRYPLGALQEKGFKIVRWQDTPPSLSEFKKVLNKSSQLWIISDEKSKLNSEYLNIIKNFFDDGHGLYVWGDNQPFYQDANFITQSIFGTTMLGNVMGDKVVSLQKSSNASGFIPNHPITTGLEYLYEGITIATIQNSTILSPLIYGSENNLVAAIYDKNGRRAIIDGGFTRLFVKWDTAGTGRYVKNAAVWLTNYEEFGDKLFIH